MDKRKLNKNTFMQENDAIRKEEPRQPVRHKTVEGWCNEHRENSSNNH